MELLHEALRTLARSRTVFHSEPDFQHALAWSIHLAHPKANIRLEIPLASPSGELDLLVALGAERIGIELKYVRASLRCNSAEESFSLRKSSLPPSRYWFWRDLSRLEQWVAAGQLTKGIALVLSNCGDCWNQPSRVTTQDAILFHNGLKVTGVLSLEDRPRSNRDFAPVVLNGKYHCEWLEYAVAVSGSNSQFRYLLLEAQPYAESSEMPVKGGRGGRN